MRRKPEMGDNFKPPYDVSDISPDTLVFVAQIYFLIAFFPYITVLAPILLYIEFKFELYNLKNLSSKAEKTSLRDVLFFIKKGNGLFHYVFIHCYNYVNCFPLFALL